MFLEVITMDVQPTISVESLKPGDILLMKDKTHDFFRHVAVVTQVDQQRQHCLVAHWRGTHYPYALTEMSLPPENIIQERNLAFHVFRLKDQVLAQRATAILQKWCLWAIPFDKTRFEKAEQYNNEFFNITSNVFEGQLPIITDMILFYPKLGEQIQLLQQQFKEHYLDVVKYAARREISPVLPKPESDEKQRGFHCLQGVLVAFQVACVQEYINPQNNQWLSNKLSKPFNQISELLNFDFDQDAFINSIPPAFQLWAKLASIEAFNFALQKDEAHVKELGVLAPQTPKLPYDHRQQEDTKIVLAYQQGLKNRARLIDEVVMPSVKVKGNEQEVNLKRKVTL